MSAPTTESRLTEALHARADLVTPDTLTPATPPMSVVPIQRRASVLVAAGVAAASVAVLAAVAASTGGPGTDEPAAPPTQSQDPTEAREDDTFHDWDPTGVPDPFDTLDRSWMGVGGTATDTGAGAPLSMSLAGPSGKDVARAGEVELVVRRSGVEARASLPAGSWIMQPAEIALGDGGPGYLVSGSFASWSVYVLRDGELVEARRPSDAPPLGSGSTRREIYESWVGAGGDALYTLVRPGRATDLYRFELVRWTVPTRDSLDLASVSLGEVCVDWAREEFGRC